MCGIAGYVNLSENRDSQKILETIKHRGPDASGVFCDEKSGWYFLHTRLSIIDLSESANQPFHSEDGRYVMVYNGEIYNHKDLAQKYALSLKTSCDTEVVLKLYQRKGPAFLSELNGMFAGAILDRQNSSVFLFRDRLGIKPLYYHAAQDSFVFASELSSLLSAIEKPALNKDALSVFLHRGYIPEPLTFYQNVCKFPSGAYGTFQEGKLSIQSYWKAEDHVQASTKSIERKVIAEVEELLRDSIRLRMMADVPFGTFLSGGADSGLVTAIASDLSTDPLNTFNVSFEDAVFDETSYARQMAEIIGSRHHNIMVRKEDVMGKFHKGFNLVGEPFADSSIFPTMAVSKFASQHVKMALSGDGGDELFMGYGAYHWAKRFENPLILHGRHLIASLLRMKGDGHSKRAANVFDFGNEANMFAHIFSQEQNLFSAAEIKDLTGQVFLDPFDTNTFKKMPRHLNNAEKQAFFDLTNYLKDDLLVKVDRASMRYGLEVRVPFLDYRLVEYSLNIDPALKSKNGVLKYIIKKMMERYYPKELIYRKKWGFSIPLEKWLKENDFFHEIQTNDPGLNQNYSQLYERYQSNPSESWLYNRLYALKTLSRFHP